MAVTPRPDSLWGELRTLKDVVRRLQLQRRLGAAAVTDPDTEYTVLYAGRLASGEFATVLQRSNDGTPALAVYGGAPGADQFVAVFDRGGNIVLSDDTASGQGLARPYVPVSFANLDMSTASGTQSATFVPLEQANAYKQQPRLLVQALVIADAATTGEVQLWDATHSVQLGATHVLAAGAFDFAVFGPVAVAGAHTSQLVLELQARRTGGTGYVRGRVHTAYGLQS